MKWCNIRILVFSSRFFLKLNHHLNFTSGIAQVVIIMQFVKSETSFSKVELGNVCEGEIPPATTPFRKIDQQPSFVYSIEIQDQSKFNIENFNLKYQNLACTASLAARLNPGWYPN